MGPNKTVSATVAPTLSSPSLPFDPRSRSRGAACQQVLQSHVQLTGLPQHAGLFGMCDGSHRFGAGFDNHGISDFQILIEHQSHGVVVGRRLRTHILRELEMHVAAFLQSQLFGRNRSCSGAGGVAAPGTAGAWGSCAPIVPPKQTARIKPTKRDLVCMGRSSPSLVPCGAELLELDGALNACRLDARPARSGYHAWEGNS